MIVVVGSLNMDFLIEAPRLPRPGETVLGTNARRVPGGKGANQAFAVARMGAEVALIGAVGHDAFGEEMVANLAAAGVDTSAVVCRADVASGTAMIVVEPGGQNQIVVDPGANGTLALRDVAQHANLIREAKAVLVQLETPVEAVATALRLGRDAGVLTVLNPAPFVKLDDELLRLCDWIIPNEIEAGQLSGVEVRDVQDVAITAQAIRRRTGRAGVVITLGEQGAWIACDSFAGHVPALKAFAVDAVGAGDTFVGAFVTQLTGGAGPREAARFASAAAAIAVTRRGAQAGIPTRAEVAARLDSEIELPPAR